jgi:hypothetical protein
MGLAAFLTPSTVLYRFNMSLKDLPAEVGVFPPAFFGQDLLDWRRGGLSTQRALCRGMALMALYRMTMNGVKLSCTVSKEPGVANDPGGRSTWGLQIS